VHLKDFKHGEISQGGGRADLEGSVCKNDRSSLFNIAQCWKRDDGDGRTLPLAVEGETSHVSL